MQPPLVNVTPRIMLDSWAKNPFMPTYIDVDSCSLLFKRVMQNLQTQEFAPEIYPKIKEKCQSYLCLSSNNPPETSLDDDFLEYDDKLISYYERLYTKINLIYNHKLMLRNLHEAVHKLGDLSLEKEDLLFSNSTSACMLKEAASRNSVVYTETEQLNETMKRIRKLEITRSDFERIHQDKKGECYTTWKRVGTVNISFKYNNI